MTAETPIKPANQPKKGSGKHTHTHTQRKVREDMKHTPVAKVRSAPVATSQIGLFSFALESMT